MLMTTGSAMEAAAVLLDISVRKQPNAANSAMVPSPPEGPLAAIKAVNCFTAPVSISMRPRAIPLAKRNIMPHMTWLSAYFQSSITSPFSSRSTNISKPNVRNQPYFFAPLQRSELFT